MLGKSESAFFDDMTRGRLTTLQGRLLYQEKLGNTNWTQWWGKKEYSKLGGQRDEGKEDRVKGRK